MFGLWKRRCVAEDTRLALGQLQHGYLEDAQNTLLDALGKEWKGGADPLIWGLGSPSFVHSQTNVALLKEGLRFHQTCSILYSIKISQGWH